MYTQRTAGEHATDGTPSAGGRAPEPRPRSARARAALVLVLALLAGAGLPGALPGGAPLAAQAQAQAGVLGRGDMVRITVYQRTDLSGEIEVGDDGSLLHPLYRGVQVAGLTPAELNARLETFLRQYQDQPAFVAEPLVRLTVAGEVREPGTVTVRPSTSLFQAVAQAGGATAQGRASRALLMREDGVQSYDLSRPDNPGAREPVQSGDVLVIGRRPPSAREYVAPVASVMAVIVSLVNLLR